MSFQPNFPLSPFFQLTLTLDTLKGSFCFLCSCFDKGASDSPWCQLKRVVFSSLFLLIFILRLLTSCFFLKLSTSWPLWQYYFLIPSHLLVYILKISFIISFLYVSLILSFYTISDDLLLCFKHHPGVDPGFVGSEAYPILGLCFRKEYKIIRYRASLWK